MARITHVKSARQRYATVPVLDENGQPKKIPVMRKDGTQKVTKHGKEVFRVLTTEDKSQPKPNRTCDKCGTEIKVGDPYKWIAPKSGPYGGHKRFRCGTCPAWQVWEYSSSFSARISQLQHEAEATLGDATGFDDLRSACESIGCAGAGTVSCTHCDGSGKAVEDDEAWVEAVDAFREAIVDELGNCPV